VVSEGAAVEGQLRLVALPLLAFISFVFFFGLGCAAAPACLLYHVVRCYIIYSGAKACFELSALSCPSGLQTITGLLHLSFGYPHYQIPNVWLMAVLNKIFLK
jgi:hypothetical protein